jgi:hypothetical protein
MRNGTPMSNEEHDLPELHLEERETAELIALMPADMQAFLCAVYPWRNRIATLLGLNRQTFNERLSVVHRMLRRMIDQRRRGEPIDAHRRRPRPRIENTAIRTQRGRRVRVAASQVDRNE